MYQIKRFLTCAVYYYHWPTSSEFFIGHHHHYFCFDGDRYKEMNGWVPLLFFVAPPFDFFLPSPNYYSRVIESWWLNSGRSTQAVLFVIFSEPIHRYDGRFESRVALLNSQNNAEARRADTGFRLLLLL